MIRLSELLPEELIEDESPAAAQAHQLGLTRKGWGYWKDKTGKAVAKTVGDELAKLSDKEKKPTEERPKWDAAEFNKRVRAAQKGMWDAERMTSGPAKPFIPS